MAASASSSDPEAASPAAGTERRAAVVYNPTKVDVERLRTAVTAAEEEHGFAESVWLETSEDDPGSGQAASAVGAGAEVVIAAGGDGTVRAVAEALRDTEVALALVPAGTGNLLARNLGLVLDRLEVGVESAFAGEDRPIDIGVARYEREDGNREEHAFLVMAGIGIDAQMIAGTDSELKKRVGWLAYVDPIVRSLFDRNRHHIRFEVDGSSPTRTRVHTILVGNCGLLPGNLMLLPEATVDDGVLDVVALRPNGLLGWVQIWSKIVWENGILHRSSTGRKLLSMSKPVRTLRYTKGKQVTVRLEEATPFELDGDVFGDVVAFRATVDPKGLTVRLPAGHRLSTDVA